MAVLNRYPVWKYVLIVVVIFAAFLYAAPNIYGEYPAVQIMGANGALVDEPVLEKASDALKKNNISYQDTLFQDQTLLFRFKSTDDQLKAKDAIQLALGDGYLVAINLSPATPNCLNPLVLCQ